MPVHYEISWRDPRERLYDVAIRFVAPCDDPRLVLPSWRPGRYLLQGFAVNVREWSSNLEKEAPSVWRVRARAGEPVEVRYRYWAGVLDAGSAFLDPEEAYFNGSNLFMWVDGLRADDTWLTVTAPAQWEVETQLPVTAAAETGGMRRTTFAARSYDHLIDSPAIAAASFRREQFEASGAKIHLVFRNAERIDTAQFIEPLRSTIAEQTALFGELPCRDYRFLVHGGDRWHGVEHEDSCSIIANRASMIGAGPGSEGFDHFLSICSHEFFHLWNVKRMMPVVFAPYDYTRPVPTRLLWAMEGMTSYFGDLTIARAGVWSEQRYLDRLAAQITALERNPSRHHLSLSQASFDGWLQEPSRPHDRNNAWFSFYTKGELVSALLDLSLRADGGSLDRIVRRLWDERLLSEDSVERACGGQHAGFFRRFVDGCETLPYAELFGRAGIAFDAKRHEVTLGATLKATDGALMVESVAYGGTAMSAGLMQNDELIALGGVRTRSRADVDNALRGVGEGEAIPLVYARLGVVSNATAVAADDGSITASLRIEEQSNPLRSDWLGRKSGL